MMHIGHKSLFSLLEKGPSRVKFSFEFFPPKTPESGKKLKRTVDALAPLGPRFVSVTCGAAGSAREGTLQTVLDIKRAGLEPAAHMTCVGASRRNIDEIARVYWDAGIKRIVALRGDLPDDGAEIANQSDRYTYASELVAGLRRIADFDISVAAYPEKHPEAASLDTDIDNLQRKLDAGADRAITQYFFDPDVYFRFLERVRARGIKAPIVAGLMPVSNFKQATRFSRMCGATVPDWLGRLFAGLDDNAESRRMAGMMVLAEQTRQLVAGGVTQFHIYTLNRAAHTLMIGRLLGLGERTAATHQLAEAS